jgi:hypothetical protein
MVLSRLKHWAAHHIYIIIMAQDVAQTTPLSLVSPGVHVLAANITALVHQAILDTNLVT